MSVWDAISALFAEDKTPLPGVTPAELDAMRIINIPSIRWSHRVENKIALDLINKGLVKLARRGYALTGRGRSVLAANIEQRSQ